TEGSELMASVFRCDLHPAPGGSPLLAIVENARESEAFVFTDFGSMGPNRTVASRERVFQRNIAGQELERLKEAARSEIQKPRSPVSKPCPFEAHVGFRFRWSGSEAWWLVSDLCQTAMLVTADQNWRGVPAIDLPRGSSETFLAFAGVDGSRPK
ncbi:MAG TPA: hypothetical protein VF723_18375, partial [Pyrinomonadaceae bacterium]